MPIANNTSGPTWPYLSGGDPGVQGANSIFATEHGWVQRHTSATGRAKDETLVAIDHLITKMDAAPLHSFVEVVTTTVANNGTNTSNVAFRLCFNQPAVVSATPTLRALRAG